MSYSNMFMHIQNPLKYLKWRGFTKLVKVCAKSENHEKNNFFFFIYFHICFLIFSYIGVEYVFINKNCSFEAFLLQEVDFLYYFHLTFIVSWMNFKIVRNLHSYLLYTAKSFAAVLYWRHLFISIRWKCCKYLTTT